MKMFAVFGAALALLAMPILSACGGSGDSGTPTPIPYITSAGGASGSAVSGQSAASPTPPPSAASTASSTAATGAGTIVATEKEFSISADKTTFAPGAVTFNVKNDGTTAHQFVVLKTDIAEDKLPTAGGTADVAAPGVTKVNGIDNIDAGKSATLTIDNLAAGTYVLICNLPAHYTAGMHTTIHIQ